MKRLTRDQAAVIGAFTGILAGPFSDMHRYIEKVLGHFTRVVEHLLHRDVGDPPLDHALDPVVLQTDRVLDGAGRQPTGRRGPRRHDHHVPFNDEDPVGVGGSPGSGGWAG